MPAFVVLDFDFVVLYLVFVAFDFAFVVLALDFELVFDLEPFFFFFVVLSFFADDSMNIKGAIFAFSALAATFALCEAKAKDGNLDCEPDFLLLPKTTLYVIEKEKTA